MDYWNSLLTEKSWQKLQELKKKHRFILIGGWAVWLWTRAHKSRDIDLIIDFEELDKFKQRYSISKNDRLKKYEARFEEIDVDIYLPHYSQLGLPLEEAMKHTEDIEGFTVLRPEALALLKQAAERARSHSEKGLKDRIDLMDLLKKAPFDFSRYLKLAKKHKLKDAPRHLKEIVQSFREHDYLGMTPRELKLKKKEILEKLQP